MGVCLYLALARMSSWTAIFWSLYCFSSVLARRCISSFFAADDAMRESIRASAAGLSSSTNLKRVWLDVSETYTTVLRKTVAASAHAADAVVDAHVGRVHIDFAARDFGVLVLAVGLRDLLHLDRAQLRLDLPQRYHLLRSRKGRERMEGGATG